MTGLRGPWPWRVRCENDGEGSTTFCRSAKKLLEYPVRIKNTNPKLASIIISQYGGPSGELGAALRYLSQRDPRPSR